MTFATRTPSFGSIRKRVSNVSLNLDWKACCSSPPDLSPPIQNESTPIRRPRSADILVVDHSLGWLAAHRNSQPVLPRFREQHIPLALTSHVVEAGEMQMHSRHQQPVGRDLIEHL